MERLSEFIVRRRKAILVVAIILLLVTTVMIPFVNVNYDLSKYLPGDLKTKQSLQVMEDEFGLGGSVQVAVKNLSITEAAELETQIEQIDGVDSVLWLSDVADIKMPISYIGADTVEAFYKDNTAQFSVLFEENDYSLRTGAAVAEIEKLVGDDGLFAGPAVNAKGMRESTGQDIVTIILFCAPLAFLILFLTTRSYIEPVIYIVLIGLSVAINMGTNLMLGEVSYFTQMCTAVLQFAISMDYSIFLLHRYEEERSGGLSPTEAMVTAVKSSFKALASSCLTTVAGLVAIMFMRYTIGFDLGFVLAKGILISLFCVLFFMPAIVLSMTKLIDKTRHGKFLPSFKGVGKIAVKLRFILPILFIVLIVPSFMAQNNNDFLYGESSIVLKGESDLSQQKNEISDIFVINNQLILLIPNDDIVKEKEFAESLDGIPYVTQVQSVTTLADSAIATEFLPSELTDQFVGENYNRLVLSLGLEEESDVTQQTVATIADVASDEFGDNYYMLGQSSSVSDIKQVVEQDYIVVTLLSVIAVAIILLITFRSISLSILLVLVIEGSIWLNMAIPYFTSGTLNFLGYMIVSSLQLGATIDYAILITGRYLANRQIMGRESAIINAIGASGSSVITSAGILCIAGMTVGLVASIQGISELGILIGRGALFSGIMVLFVLPALLALFDKFIGKTTLKSKFLKETTEVNKQ